MNIAVLLDIDKKCKAPLLLALALLAMLLTNGLADDELDEIRAANLEKNAAWFAQMQAIAEVYEADLPRVAVGQRAEITSPVLGQTLTGQVRRIRQRVRKQDETASDPAARKDARIIEVEILLDQPEHVAGLTNLQVTVLISP